MTNWIKGMDLSTLPEVEACGGKFFSGGKQGDAMKILKDHGMNLVRLRLWNDPYSETGVPYGAGTDDLPRVMEIARRAKNMDVDWMLDLQYSDFWTDPGKQIPPKAWADMTPSQLEQAVYDYTKAVLIVLRESRLTPALVSVGNELSCGLLWPSGQYPQFHHIARYLSAGIRAVREIAPGVPVMIHLDNGCRNELFHDWLDQYFANGGADFEYIGMSYYPFWHGQMEQLKKNLNDLASSYGKDMIVTETASGFSLQDYQEYEKLPADKRVGPAANPDTLKDVPYEVTPEGQCQFIRDLTDVLRQVPGGHGKGYVYWEPAWLPVPGSQWADEAGLAYMKETKKGGNEWANQCLFDYDGHALPALKVIRDY
ncbi:MAG: glycosyl hydrolase 53 family protein [Eubacteriales bacterium]|nr:glycosyl hydrolase 53 family protein [Eubacteriales bacterium]